MPPDLGVDLMPTFAQGPQPLELRVAGYQMALLIEEQFQLHEERQILRIGEVLLEFFGVERRGLLGVEVFGICAHGLCPRTWL